MMEFIATNFNLPTIIVAALVFGALGWVVWHTHKHGGGCSCGGGLKLSARAPFLSEIKLAYDNTGQTPA